MSSNTLVRQRIWMPVDPGRRDLGRLVFMPVCLLLLIINATQLATRHAYAGRTAASAVGAIAATVLTIAFYALVVRAYLTRLPAQATSSSRAAAVAAFLGSALPFVMPLLGSSAASGARLVIGDLLMLTGFAWSVWALRTLGRSFSVIPQARAVVSSGPYRVVRHPLYLGEIVSMMGLAVLHASPAAYLAWFSLCCLQVYRATHEERVLAGALDDYVDYRRRTRRIVPGLY